MPATQYSISLLDHLHRREGQPLLTSFHEMLELATLADRIGYKRIWFSEHHENPMYGSCAPEITIPLVAARTRNIRVGSGGVMLSNYRPAKVAETFNLLGLLYPKRIDLGIGFASGGPPHVAGLIGPSIQEEIADKLRALHDLSQKSAELSGNEAPNETWILSSGSPATIDLAVEHRAGLVCAQFLNTHILEEVGLEFKRKYESRWGEKAKIILAVDLITGKDRASVRRNLQYRSLHSAIMRKKKDNIAFPSSMDALNLFSPQEWQDAASSMGRTKIIGSFQEVDTHFSKISGEFGIDEFMVHLYAPDLQERMHLIEGLANASLLKGERD